MQSNHFTRTITAALIAAFVVLGLPAAQAAPSCGGRQATKVGTKGNDEIKGTQGPDVIVALDGNDDIYVAWELFDDHRRRPIGLGFAVSRDAGRTFSAPAFVPESADRAGRRNANLQGLLTKKLAVNGGGAIAIVNSSLKDNDGSRIWLIRGQSPN
jgi:hypothetical protein